MPNRMIREGLLDSEKFNSLGFDSQNFFVRLMLCADDFGRFDGRPAVLKARAYPLSDGVKISHIEKMIADCQKVGLIVVYEVNGKSFIEVPNFEQRLRAKKSKFPHHDGHVTVICQTDDGTLLTDDGHPRATIDKMLETEEKRSGSGSEAEEKLKPTHQVESCLTFEQFWDKYAKKIELHKCQKVFSKLTEPEKQLIRQTLPAYIQSTPEIQYRKNPLTYLNRKCWLDPVQTIQKPREVFRG